MLLFRLMNFCDLAPAPLSSVCDLRCIFSEWWLFTDLVALLLLLDSWSVRFVHLSIYLSLILRFRCIARMERKLKKVCYLERCSQKRYEGCRLGRCENLLAVRTDFVNA